MSYLNYLSIAYKKARKHCCGNIVSCQSEQTLGNISEKRT